jgi:hypothetical protein
MAEVILLAVVVLVVARKFTAVVKADAILGLLLVVVLANAKTEENTIDVNLFVAVFVIIIIHSCFLCDDVR